MGSRLLDVNNFPVFEKKELDAFTFDVTCSDFHMMLRKMQRDMGIISEKEMAMAEQVIGGAANYSTRTIFNPFTGEIRKERIFLD